MWGVGKFYTVLRSGGALRSPSQFRGIFRVTTKDVEYYGTRFFGESCRRNATGRDRRTLDHSAADGRFSRTTVIGLGSMSAVALSCLVGLAAAKANPKFRAWLDSRLPFFKPVTKLFIDDHILSFQKDDKRTPDVSRKLPTSSSASLATDKKDDEAIGRSSSTVAKEKVREEEEERKRHASLAAAQRQKEEEGEKERRLEQRRKLEEAERIAQEETVRLRKQQAAEEVATLEKKKAKQAEERKEVANVNAVAVQASLLKLISAATETGHAQRELSAAVQAYTNKLYDVVKARASHDDEQVIAASHKAELCSQEINGSELRAQRSVYLFQQAKLKFDEATREARSLGLGNLSDEARKSAGPVLREVDDRVEESSQALADLSVMEGFCQQMAERHSQYKQGLVQLKEAATDDVSDQEVLSAQSSYDNDLQSLLAFAQQRVEQMELMLSERQRREAEGTALLLEQQRQEDHHVMQLRLDHLKQQLERQNANELQEKAIEAQRIMEDEVHKQLKRQAVVHNEHLSHALTEQADRLQEEWRRQLEVELGEQADTHLKNMEKLAASFRGSEETAEDVRRTVLAGRSTLVLGQACQSLAAAVDTSSARIQPLAPLLDCVQSVLPNDEFVKAVAKTVPCDVREHGVQSSFTLRKRFPHVKRTCGRVALIGEKGGGLGTYLLSYFQSILLLQKQTIGSSSDDYLVESPSMSTYDILNAAERQLELGRMDNTVRLLNQLKGQSHVLAEDWIQQAQLLLATQQAVELLNAYSTMLATHVNLNTKTDCLER